MAKSRKDNKGRVLRKGETQRSCDGKYVYTYVDPEGKRRSIYSKDIMELREREVKLMKDQLDGLDAYAAGTSTINFVFDRYISTKAELRETTMRNYKYMYDRFIRGGFGKKKIAAVKYSDVLQFYQHLLKEKEMQINTLETIHETVRLTPVVYDSDIEILHRPVSDHSRRDFSTYIKAFARGTQLEDYVITMLCKELYISGSDKDFMDFKDIFADILINENRSDDIRQEVNCVLVKIYRIAGDMGEFFKLALRCVADNPSSEICYELGNYYYDINDYAEAAMWYYNAIYETSSVLDITSGGNKPLYALSRCYDKLSETSEDIEQIAQFRQMAEDYKYQAEQWKLPDEIV